MFDMANVLDARGVIAQHSRRIYSLRRREPEICDRRKLSDRICGVTWKKLPVVRGPFSSSLVSATSRDGQSATVQNLVSPAMSHVYCRHRPTMGRDGSAERHKISVRRVIEIDGSHRGSGYERKELTPRNKSLARIFPSSTLNLETHI